MTAADLSNPDDRRRWYALALLAVAQFVVVLDASIVNVALPSIGRELEFSQENLAWVVNAYVLTFGGFLLLGGRMADLLGRRRVFVGGLLLFAAASLAGGLAQSEGQLIAARAVQGLGAAILSPAALSIVTTIFSQGADRNRALGVWGAVSVTAGLSVLVYALVDATDAGWGSTQTVALLALSAVLLAAFVVIELRSSHPLVPFRFFRQRTVTGSNVVGLLVGASLFSMFFFISLYMQQVLGYEPLKAGVAYLPLAVTIMASAGIASQLTTKVGFKPVLAVGLVFIAAGLLWFSQVSPHGSYLGDILGPSLLAAVGLGFSFVPVTIGAVSGVAEHESGLASGLINTAQQIGGALGLAVLATIANSRTDDAMAAAGGDPAALPRALTEGFQTAFAVGAGFALVGLVLALTLIRNRDSRAHTQQSALVARAAA